MSEYPEQIWATGNAHYGSWNSVEVRHADHQVQYIRADMHAALLKAEREKALREAAHLMPRYFGVWSSTGVHVGVWEDGTIAAKVVGEYPGGVMRELIDINAIFALIEKEQADG